MKLRKSNEQGAVLLIVLISSLILGITLASYLQYTATQTRSIMRSQAWNSAIPVAEAGIEEAMAHINNSVIGTNWTLNGWTVVSNQFEKSGRAIGGKYVAQISADELPIITCTGFATDGRAGVPLVRKVQVTTSRFATGLKGLVTKSDLIMVGNASIDSFDSEDARYNTGGRYDPAKHKDGGYAASVYGNFSGQVVHGSVGTGPTGTATGTVGDFGWTKSSAGIQPGHYANDVNFSFPDVQPPFSGGGATPTSGTVTLTNYSYLTSIVTSATMPNPLPAGTITTNFSGTNTVASYPIGVLAHTITTNTTHSRTKSDPVPGTFLNLTVQGQWNEFDLITSYSYPAVTYSYSSTGTNAIVLAEAFEYVLRSDRYEVSSLRLSGGQRLVVIGPEVTLYIKDGFSMSGSSEFIIAPGASVKIYVGGDVSLSGNGIMNHTLNAASFQLFGLPTTKKIDISGNAAFTGVIYAPQADVTMNGGGNNTYDVVGAIVANSAKMNGHFNFHYDEALGRAKILSKYSVASWRELNPEDAPSLLQSF
jgi:hypothetical protein